MLSGGGDVLQHEQGLGDFPLPSALLGVGVLRSGCSPGCAVVRCCRCWVHGGQGREQLPGGGQRPGTEPGTEHALVLPAAAGVGRGQFRQPADSGSRLHHAHPAPQLPLSHSKSRLPALRALLGSRGSWLAPGPAGGGHPGAAPCPAARRDAAAGQAGPARLLRAPRAGGTMRCCSPRLPHPIRWSWDIARCVNTVTTGEMFSPHRHLPKFSCS